MRQICFYCTLKCIPLSFYFFHCTFRTIASPAYSFLFHVNHVSGNDSFEKDDVDDASFFFLERERELVQTCVRNSHKKYVETFDASKGSAMSHEDHAIIKK